MGERMFRSQEVASGCDLRPPETKKCEPIGEGERRSIGEIGEVEVRSVAPN